ncbi:sigma-54-dependent Fis family transcriptional regulator [Bacillota bacterium]
MIKSKDYRRITDKIFSLMDEGLHVVDAEGKTVIYNAAMAKMEKMNPDEVLRKPFREVFSHIEEGRSTMLRALKYGKATSNIQQTYQNIDGREITTINSTHPLILEGKIVGAVEIAKNITDVQNLSKTILEFQKEAPEPEERRENKIKAYSFDMIIGQNAGFLEAVNRAKKAAGTDASVLIYGDTGTGKELLAQSIHYHSRRGAKPLLAQNCAALPENLLEGLLFGTAKGGFTGAMDREGLFEQANGGSLILDEISAMPYELQGKLLRVLQEDYLRRVGGTRDIPLNVRIIATINEPAEKLIEKGRLRKDLYYRLAIININVPSLRERRDDIILLAEHFLEKHNKRFGKEVWMLSESARLELLEYDYPGNVRELENIIMAGVSMTDDEHLLSKEHLRINKKPGLSGDDFERALESGLPLYLQNVENRLIEQAMVSSGGNISRAAKELGITRQALQHKLKRKERV